ncbi:hypothetical protein [Halopiger thermotolerans]
MQSLPPRAQDALEVLSDKFDHGNGFPEPAAIQTLIESGFDEEQAKRLVEFLHDAGYLYQVKGIFYITSLE